MRPQDPFIGREILNGSFRILQKIGSGGMGAVYKAMEIENSRMVGIKILHPKLANRKDLVSRFGREARALSQLSHPNTVRVFAYGELEDGALYIIMELLEGKNLNQTVRTEGPMPIARALPILIQSCGALDEAHKAGIIHRDLKPENIFLVQGGALHDFPKLLDFGLAKVGERQLRPGSVILTQEGMVFGTPEFMSPEQAQGKTLTPASDVYSLAVILYEVLTGKLPFDAKSAMDFIQMHVTTKPIALNKRAPGRTFPPLLEQVMDRALAKKTDDRFASAADFAVAMQAVLQGAEVLPPEAFASSPKAAPVAPRAPAPVPLPAPVQVHPHAHAPVAALAPPRAPAPLAKTRVPMLAGIAVGFLLIGIGLAVALMKWLAAPWLDQGHAPPGRATFAGMVTRARRPPPGAGDTLFAASAKKSLERGAPLAERMRPNTLGDLVGQKHVLGPHSLLSQAISGDRVRSMILWGPPGSGKTTLARVIAGATKSHFVPFSAVLGSVGELREIVAAARDRLAFHAQRTIVLVDEIHRFNKAQQDAFLPHVEDGTIVVVGATTENPSFAVNAALLSRCKVFRLEALGVDDLVELLGRALRDEAHGLGSKHLTAEEGALRAIADAARGDARQALSSLEIVADWLDTSDAGADEPRAITLEAVAKAESHRPLLYDKSGEEHYNVVSAFIKSMRGSDPDAAVYWMMRMIAAGDDPLFVARRMLIFASEDVGNADPQALLVASSADAVLRRVGMPEGTYALAQACCYLATAPKSNACNAAWHRAKELIDQHGALAVPKKLRNAVTPLMREEGYGAGYKYAHNFEGGIVEGETYLPDEVADEVLYQPTDRGAEAAIGTRLARLARTGPAPGDESLAC